MSRLMIGVLVLMLMGLMVSGAWAQGVGGSDESKYVDGPPPAYDPSTPNGFPLDATATFKATVLNYARIDITPPDDLIVPGDEGGNAGEDSIAWDDAARDPGMIEVQANTTCQMAVEVTEFTYGDTFPEQIWTEVQLGELEGKDFAGWQDMDPLPNNCGWQRIATADHDWFDFGQTTVSKGTQGTIILSRTMDPLADYARYWRLPFGVKAKNRTWTIMEGRDGDGVAPSYGYDVLALAEEYTATMYVTLTKP